MQANENNSTASDSARQFMICGTFVTCLVQKLSTLKCFIYTLHRVSEKLCQWNRFLNNSMKHWSAQSDTSNFPKEVQAHILEWAF